MKPPILIEEKAFRDEPGVGIFEVFPSQEAAEGYIEAVDVLDEVYIAYDSEGRLLRFEVFGYQGPGTGSVELHNAESAPTHEEELVRKLRTFFERTDAPPDWLATASLEQVVEYSLRYAKSEPKGCLATLVTFVRRLRAYK